MKTITKPKPPETIDWDTIRLREKGVGGNTILVARVKNNRVMTLSFHTRDGAKYGYFKDFTFVWSDCGSTSPVHRNDWFDSWDELMSAVEREEKAGAVFLQFDDTREFSAWFRKNTHLTF